MLIPVVLMCGEMECIIGGVCEVVNIRGRDSSPFIVPLYVYARIWAVY